MRFLDNILIKAQQCIYSLFLLKTEDSEDDQVDSDFDVDESGWGPDDEAEEKIQKAEKEKKKKQWIKPYKQLVSYLSMRNTKESCCICQVQNCIWPLAFSVHFFVMVTHTSL